MIVRLAANAAVHTAAGAALGLAGVLAACTVARTAKTGMCRLADPVLRDKPENKG